MELPRTYIRCLKKVQRNNFYSNLQDPVGIPFLKKIVMLNLFQHQTLKYPSDWPGVNLIAIGSGWR